MNHVLGGLGELGDDFGDDFGYAMYPDAFPVDTFDGFDNTAVDAQYAAMDDMTVEAVAEAPTETINKELIGKIVNYAGQMYKYVSALDSSGKTVSRPVPVNTASGAGGSSKAITYAAIGVGLFILLS